MSSKQEFWDSVVPVDCPEPDCDKQYQHRRFMIYHMINVHGYSWDKAKRIVDSTGIYVPEHDIGR